MATTPEGKVKAAVKKLLDARGIWYFMPAANGFGKVGIPDFICCWRSYFLAVETKAPGKEKNLTENQKRRIEEIEEHGGYAVVVSSAEDLNYHLDNLELAQQVVNRMERAA